AGSTAGRLSSLATVGAIIGTFGSALALVPAIGTQRTLLVSALLVALVSIPLLLRPAVATSLVIVALLAIPPAAVKPGVAILVERETQYQYVQVARDPDGKLVLSIDEGVSD